MLNDRTFMDKHLYATCIYAVIDCESKVWNTVLYARLRIEHDIVFMNCTLPCTTTLIFCPITTSTTRR